MTAGGEAQHRSGGTWGPALEIWGPTQLHPLTSLVSALNLRFCKVLWAWTLSPSLIIWLWN